MRTYINPPRSEWFDLCKRPVSRAPGLRESVERILREVQERGDAAVLEFTQAFDGGIPTSLRLSAADLSQAAQNATQEVSEAVTKAIATIGAFHSSQVVAESPVETVPGLTCYRRSIPIERVGIYIPAGSAPLFSTLLMLAIPARIAGCREIVLCTPGGARGSIDPVIARCAQLLEINEVYLIGGAQAIAALAYGTETVQRVDKICGPGNSYVTEAKLQVSAAGTAIDMGAGPSEVLVIADSGARPRCVAADLLAQAEHGPDSQVVLVTPDRELASRVTEELTTQLAQLSRQSIAQKALNESFVVVTSSLEEAIEFSNLYAPEHLLLSVSQPDTLATMVTNAGSVFLGYWAAETLGDYASGTNHVLPTNGLARAVSGVSVDTFVKKVTFQKVSAAALKELSPTVVTMARAEGLEAHAQAVLVREEESNGY